MTEDFYINQLLQKYSNQTDTSDKQQLEERPKTAPDDPQMAFEFEEIWKLSSQYTAAVTINLDREFELLRSNLTAEATPAKIIPLKPHRLYRKPQLYRKWQLAASILLLIVAGFLYVYQFGARAEWQEISFAMQQTDALVLPDGSKIWANADAVISYPRQFEGGTRQLKLTGEAFFDITSNPDLPFVIETPTSRIKVLGTSFNVRDINEESEMQVHVATGVVEVTVKSTHESVVLHKGQQSIYNRGDQSLQVNSSGVENKMAWHTHKLAFSKTPLFNVLQTVNSLFDVEITVENQNLLTCEFTSRFNHVNPWVVIEQIKRVYNFELDQKSKNQYILKGGSCKDD